MSACQFVSSYSFFFFSFFSSQRKDQHVQRLLCVLSPNDVHLLGAPHTSKYGRWVPLREKPLPEVLFPVALVVVVDLNEEEEGPDVVAHHVHPNLLQQAQTRPVPQSQKIAPPQLSSISCIMIMAHQSPLAGCWGQPRMRLWSSRPWACYRCRGWCWRWWRCWSCPTVLKLPRQPKGPGPCQARAPGCPRTPPNRHCRCPQKAAFL